MEEANSDQDVNSNNTESFYSLCLLQGDVIGIVKESSNSIWSRIRCIANIFMES